MMGPALAPPITGLIYDRCGSYTPAFLACAVLLAASLFLGAVLLAQAERRRAAA